MSRSSSGTTSSADFDALALGLASTDFNLRSRSARAARYRSDTSSSAMVRTMSGGRVIEFTNSLSPRSAAFLFLSLIPMDWLWSCRLRISVLIFPSSVLNPLNRDSMSPKMPSQL